MLFALRTAIFDTTAALNVAVARETFWHVWFPRYRSGQTRQRDRDTNTLIALFRTLVGGDVIVQMICLMKIFISLIHDKCGKYVYFLEYFDVAISPSVL